MNKKTLFAAAFASALLAACGGQDSGGSSAPAAPAAAPAPAPAPAPAAPAAAPAPAPAPAAAAGGSGESVYKRTCALCHAAGVAGAPKLDDKADWDPRIAQGTETLYKHAIEGFTGAKGVMPPRGGAANLSDDELKAAVDHMVAVPKK